MARWVLVAKAACCVLGDSGRCEQGGASIAAFPVSCRCVVLACVSGITLAACGANSSAASAAGVVQPVTHHAEQATSLWVLNHCSALTSPNPILSTGKVVVCDM
jgi:hypothetical protein